MSETTQPPGRRERKKAATRRSLADAALALFLQHGYDQVSIKDVADAADVSTTTVFKHFPGKEALVFDEDADEEARLVAVVRERPAGQSLITALREHVLHTYLKTSADASFAAFRKLTRETPALRQYGHRMWMRHETALAQAIAEDAGRPADDPAAAALAHFALDSTALTGDREESQAVIEAAFDLLEHGWTGS
ncbi:helix-turn-helix domain-containing protein [Amycolatopsis sp. PS_44_ISF1]|uniref:TetR/AcrR family transcriptional regulator n=1 Tax=Amycolatopsis sp. PS_44_ISF1 TaxID=2974917 RepID=UPI0028E075BC|nr:helix-turn-helix domain-containing protein [Amycolatopsis sp. PS_44_ISF1]MDT8915941.1 TetR/AcrR family transcriptional regulator [Amycolatopsis sp. PS_44_ISF1]